VVLVLCLGRSLCCSCDMLEVLRSKRLRPFLAKLIQMLQQMSTSHDGIA